MNHWKPLKLLFNLLKIRETYGQKLFCLRNSCYKLKQIAEGVTNFMDEQTVNKNFHEHKNQSIGLLKIRI